MFNTKYNNTKIYIIPIIGLISIVSISLLFVFIEIRITKDYVASRFKDKISSAELTFDNEIVNAKHTIYGLGTTIAEGTIVETKEELNDLIQNFDRGNDFDQSITNLLTEIIFVDVNQEKIISSYNLNKKTKKEYINVKQCLAEKTSEALKPHIGAIKTDNITKESIIPVSMIIVDASNEMIGTLCSGILVREINRKLNFLFDSRYFDSLSIINLKLASSTPITNLDELSNKLKNTYFSQDASFFYKIHNYPFAFEIKLKHYFLKNAIYRYGMFLYIGCLILCISFYCFYREIKKPLKFLKDKINLLEQTIGGRGLYLAKSDGLNDCFDESFFKSINNLIDEKYGAFLEGAINNIERDDLKKKILNLIFIEQHFLSYQKTKIKEDKILLSKLYAVINEEAISLSLQDFFDQFGEYCAEFYHEIIISYRIDDNKVFSLKQSMLIECIISIINFISRYNAFAEEVILEARFDDNNDYPTIIVKAKVLGNDLVKNLGWEVGPLYSSSSLLTIYLLARENNLFFSITQERDEVFFILDPFSQKVDFYNLAISNLLK